MRDIIEAETNNETGWMAFLNTPGGQPQEVTHHYLSRRIFTMVG